MARVGEYGPGRAGEATEPTAGRYSSKIIKAGALPADTKTLFSNWDTSASVRANLTRIRQQNVFGKASRSRVEDILAVFRQRYLGERAVTTALVTLVRNRAPSSIMDRILYFHAARADLLLYDVVVDWLSELQRQGISDVDVGGLQRLLGTWVAEGKTRGDWSEETRSRVAQGLLSTLRDFGVLQGAARKRIVPAYLPVQAFAYVMFYLEAAPAVRDQARGTSRLETVFPGT